MTPERQLEIMNLIRQERAYQAGGQLELEGGLLFECLGAIANLMREFTETQKAVQASFRLEVENVRLREALKLIKNNAPETFNSSGNSVWEIAQAALREEKE